MEPMNPRDAVEAYLADCKHELAASSHKNHRSRLDALLVVPETVDGHVREDTALKEAPERGGAVRH
jgi:hypothetical protein